MKDNRKPPHAESGWLLRMNKNVSVFGAELSKLEYLIYPRIKRRGRTPPPLHHFIIK